MRRPAVLLNKVEFTVSKKKTISHFAGDMGTEDRKEILVVELYFFEKGG
jgi:hypothetical protein